METIADFLGIGASVASGGLFGLLGSVVGRFFNFFNEREIRKFEEKKWEHETHLLELQMRAKNEETEREIDLANASGSWAGLTASINAEAASLGSVPRWANAVRTLFRPFLTVIMIVFALYVFARMVKGDLSAWMEGTEVTALVSYMVYNVFFTASTCVVWWFGDRALTPPKFKNR